MATTNKIFTLLFFLYAAALLYYASRYFQEGDAINGSLYNIFAWLAAMCGVKNILTR